MVRFAKGWFLEYWIDDDCSIVYQLRPWVKWAIVIAASVWVGWWIGR